MGACTYKVNGWMSKGVCDGEGFYCLSVCLSLSLSLSLSLTHTHTHSLSLSLSLFPCSSPSARVESFERLMKHKEVRTILLLSSLTFIKKCRRTRSSTGLHHFQSIFHSFSLPFSGKHKLHFSRAADCLCCNKEHQKRKVLQIRRLTLDVLNREN